MVSCKKMEGRHNIGAHSALTSRRLGGSRTAAVVVVAGPFAGTQRLVAARTTHHLQPPFCKAGQVQRLPSRSRSRRHINISILFGSLHLVYRLKAAAAPSHESTSSYLGHQDSTSQCRQRIPPPLVHSDSESTLLPATDFSMPTPASHRPLFLLPAFV
jgi:hypothetical protein